MSEEGKAAIFEMRTIAEKIFTVMVHEDDPSIPCYQEVERSLDKLKTIILRELYPRTFHTKHVPELNIEKFKGVYFVQERINAIWRIRLSEPAVYWPGPPKRDKMYSTLYRGEPLRLVFMEFPLCEEVVVDW